MGGKKKKEKWAHHRFLHAPLVTPLKAIQPTVLQIELSWPCVLLSHSLSIRVFLSSNGFDSLSLIKTWILEIIFSNQKYWSSRFISEEMFSLLNAKISFRSLSLSLSLCPKKINPPPLPLSSFHTTKISLLCMSIDNLSVSVCLSLSLSNCLPWAPRSALSLSLSLSKYILSLTLHHWWEPVKAWRVWSGTCSAKLLGSNPEVRS